MPYKQTAKTEEEIKRLIDQIFLLPPKTKDELKEVFPKMTNEDKEEFERYIDEILVKQDEILSYIIKNNPDFVSNLKEFKEQQVKNLAKEIENISKESEEMDMKSLLNTITQ